MNLDFDLDQSVLLKPSTILMLGTLALLALSSYVPGWKGISVILASLLAFILGEIAGEWRFRPQMKVSSAKLHYFGLSLIVVSLFALYLDFFTAGGIPFFTPAIRRFLSPVLTSLAFLIVPGTVFTIPTLKGHKRAKLYTFLLIFFAAAMMTLLGYRTEVLAAIIASMLTAYYCGIFKLRDLGFMTLVAFAAFSGITLLRTGAVANSARASVTFAAFDFLVAKTPILGLAHGFVQFADFFKLISEIPIYGGRVLASNLIGARVGVSITSTLYGPPYIDFGIFGMLMFFLFGFVLGAGHKAAFSKKGVYAASHSLLLTFLLLGIETGITDLIVWTYFIFISVFYLLAHNYEA